MEQKKSHRLSGLFLILFFGLSAAGLVIFEGYFKASQAMRQLMLLGAWAAVFLLVILIFRNIRMALDDKRAGKGKKRVKREKLSLKQRFLRLKAAFTQRFKEKLGKKKEKEEEPSGEKASICEAPKKDDNKPVPLELKDSDAEGLLAGTDEPHRESASGDEPLKPEEETGRAVSAEKNPDPEEGFEPLEDPEGLLAIREDLPVTELEEEDGRPFSVRLVDSLYILCQVAILGLFLYRAMILLLKRPSEDMSAYSYTHVLAVMMFAVACFVIRRFAREGDRGKENTGSTLLLLTGTAGAGVAALTAASIMLKVNAAAAASFVVAGISVFAFLVFLFGLLFAAVRLEATENFTYTISDLLDGKDGGGKAFFDALEANTGISLKSLWSVKYAIRILPGLLLCLLFLILCSTCLFQVETYQQAAVYRLGKLAPSSIYSEGLHVKLPWPIDKAEYYDVARSQQMTIGYESAVSRNYLWTESHGGEEFTLLLGDGNELVSVNMRVKYSIDDLYQYLTYASRPEDLLSARCYDIIMHKTVVTNLDNFLNVDRQSLSREVREELSAYCREAGLGLKVEDIIVENIHPAIEVAPVYQSVVSADVRRATLKSRAEDKALGTIIQAEKQSKTLVADATTNQHDRTSDAIQEMAVYTAAFEAFDVSPECFLLTKYLDAYQKVISSSKVYVTGEGVDPSRLFLGGRSSSGPLAAGWADIEDLMDAAEEKKAKEKEDEFVYFGWTDDE